MNNQSFLFYSNRELEGLKLTCAELERSQMDAERQSQDCAIR